MDQKILNVGLMNAALIPASQERGHCLCIHAFMDIIDFRGMYCDWCRQEVTGESYGPAAREIRTEIVKAAYPWAVKE